MNLVFYYAPNSSAVTVHWALEELGVPYQKVKLDLQARDQDKADFRALNPNGLVPTIVHDGTPIFESAAIIIHLGETLGVEKKLFPAAGMKRAEALKWIVWVNATLNEAISRRQHNTAQYFPAEQHNAKAAEKAKGDVDKLLAVLDKSLAGKTWLVGDSFSLADVHAIGWAAYAGICGFKLPPNVDAWVKRGAERPGFGVAMSPT
jgi:glutathione S-transferase